MLVVGAIMGSFLVAWLLIKGILPKERAPKDVHWKERDRWER